MAGYLPLATPNFDLLPATATTGECWRNRQKNKACMENLQGPINFLFFLFIYVPINIVLMLFAAIIFNVVNKVFNLNFPSWALASGAGLLVFLCMFAMLDGIANKGGWVSLNDGSAGFYFGTFVINIVVVTLMLTMSGVKNLVFKNAATPTFAFAKPQIIATVVYGVLAVFLAITPLIRQGNKYISEVQNTAMLQALKKNIELNNVAAFEQAAEKNYTLWNLKLEGEQRPLFDYLVSNDKPDLVHVLLRQDKNLFGYTFDFDVQSNEMMDMLIADGMNPVQAVEIATKNGRATLVKAVVEKHQPVFDTLVSFICYNLVRQNDVGLLDYLIEKGLAKNTTQTSKTIADFAQLNNFDAVKLLTAKGFTIDTSYNNAIRSAIYNHNLPMLKFFFQYPFDVNAFNDEYTNVENAIIGNQEDIFDYLLTLKPDVKTLHITKLNGETNALLIAERYKQPEMLAKLQAYDK
jgi:hypothetical protein